MCKGREYSVLWVYAGVGSVRREARGRAKGREKATRRRPIKVQHMISHLIPLKKITEKKRDTHSKRDPLLLSGTGGLGGGEGKREGRGREGEKEGGQSTVDEASEHAWGETRGTPSLSITTNKTLSAPPGLQFPRALAR